MVMWFQALARGERRCAMRRCLIVVLLICLGLLASRPVQADPASQSPRQRVLLYYGDETSTQAIQSENYAALLAVLRSSSAPRAAVVAAGVVSDADKFPRLIQRDVDTLQQEAKRLGFDLAIFTNALAFDGRFLLYRADTGSTERLALPPVPPAANTILAASPLSRPEYLRAALFSVGALYPKNTLDIVLITNSHGGRDMALIPRVNADLSQAGAAAAMREMLETGDNGEPPDWAVPKGTTKISFWQVLADASSAFGIRYPLVFRETCVGGLRSWTEFFTVPSSVGLIADSGMDEINGWDLDYANLLGSVSPGSDWAASLAEALKLQGLNVQTRTTAWIDVLLIWLHQIPIAAFFVPLALWLGWFAVAKLRERRRTANAGGGAQGTSASIP
jgi:hypothetical protein